MRRFLCLVLALALLGLPFCSRGEEDSFVVVEDDSVLRPDPRRQARALMRLMTEEEKVCQLFLVTPEMLTGEKYTLALPEGNVFSRYPVGGVALYGQNIASETQLAALTASLQAQARAAGMQPLFIGVHEAGGSLSRVANKLGRPYAPGPEELPGYAEEVRSAGAYIGGYLAPLGINLDLAVPLDMQIAAESDVSGRTYGADPARVSLLAGGFAEGLRAEGVIPCFGHFPNDGSLGKKNYYGTAVNRRSLEEMRRTEFLPYADQIAAGAEMIMMSHGVARSLGDDVPASLSPRMIGILRQEMGYDGVVITESLRMPCIVSFYKPGEAAVLALQAGADLVFLPADLSAAVQAVFRALDTGSLTWDRIEKSVERVLALKISAGVIR